MTDAEHRERYRWMFVFSLDGDLRFVSHHDTLRLFRRALARAELPVRFSQGFNPHPRLTIPVPRPVGIASDADALFVETDLAMNPSDAQKRLDQHTPGDIRVISARTLEDGDRPLPESVRYRMDADAVAGADLDARIREVLARETIEVERKTPRSTEVRIVDIRPFVADLRIDGAFVEFMLRITGGGTAKPAEVAGLLGCDPVSINHRIRRLEIKWR